MTKFSKISLDGVSENQVLRSNVAKTQQPDAEGLKYNKWCLLEKKVLK